MSDEEVKDLRLGERFLLVAPLAGSLGGVAVQVRNVAMQGAQIEHAEPLRIGVRARLSFRGPNGVIAAPALVIWSRLSQTPNDEGKYLYRSGVRIEEETDDYAHGVRKLYTGGHLRRDPDSLERKKQRLVEREQQRAQKPMMKIIRTRPDPEISPDQELLIRHAREWLREHAQDAQKWYNRARFTTVEEGVDVAADLPYREDVIAVWEFLERSVSLEAIMRVFERP